MQLPVNKHVPKSSFKMEPGPPGYNMGPGPGPEGPWALRPQHLAVNLEHLGRSKNAFYAELAGCCEVSETA